MVVFMAKYRLTWTKEDHMYIGGILGTVLLILFIVWLVRRV
jgi:hypothetical protein